ncbi:MAG: hypothetical protein JNJ78_23720 [Anaerolineae bacterium]|nr:hypothetical protein [Anaerolineae bacterium]
MSSAPLPHPLALLADMAVFVCASSPLSRPQPAACLVMSAASPLTAAHMAGLAVR